MTEWAEIVYGRTLEVDFRFLAAPIDDQAQLLKWAEPYILASTCLPEKLFGKPRWSIIRGEHYCMIGVTCMANELIAVTSDSLYKSMGSDNHGRSLYLFTGYICRVGRRSDKIALPAYEKLDLSLFAQSYRLVAENWAVKQYEPKARKPVNTFFRDNSFRDVIQYVVSNVDQELNTDQKYIKIFPDNDEMREKLWTQMLSSGVSSSLCLGLSRKRDVIDGPFINATMHSAISSELVSLQSTESQFEPAKISPINVQPTTKQSSRSIADTGMLLSVFSPCIDKVIAAAGGVVVGLGLSHAFSIPALPTTLTLGIISYVGLGLVQNISRNKMDHKLQNTPLTVDSFESKEKLFGLKSKSSNFEKNSEDSNKINSSPWKL